MDFRMVCGEELDKIDQGIKNVLNTLSEGKFSYNTGYYILDQAKKRLDEQVMDVIFVFDEND